MTLNKKILAAAVVSGLFATAAQAQVNISVATPVPVTFASESVVPTGGLVLTNLANALDLQTALRYSFSAGEVRHARIECSSNIRFVTGSAVSTTAGVNATFGAINGIGTNAIHFSITAADNTVTAPSVITVSGNRNVTNTAGGSCTYSLYDQPSQAANGGETGRITTVTGAYLAFATSYTFTTPLTATATASVEATPSFTAFAPSGQTTATVARLAQFTTAHVANRLASGAAITALTDLMVAPVRITVTGDFSAAANADGTYTGTALPRVWIDATGTGCTAGSGINADLLSATSARFTIPTPFALTAQNLCFQPRAGVLIPASTYTAVFTPTAATGFVTPAIGPRNAGEIVRDGTQLQAPLAQVPAGWLSRVVLTNTGSVARPYAITAQTEAGTTATMGSAATGSVPANGTLVLNVADIATFTGQPRGTLNVTIAGPTAQNQGLYQIVNPTSGSISNHVMVRPGTN